MKAHRHLALILTLISVPFTAQPQGLGVQYHLERAAHEALRDVRTAPDAKLLPFVTDGCSGGLSDGWRLLANTFPDFSEAHEQNPPWEACCVVHDRAYHSGGADPAPEMSYTARLTADEALEACVVAEGNKRAEDGYYDADPDTVRSTYAGVARLMYLSVRVGGGPCTGLSWRWGFGYDQCW